MTDERHDMQGDARLVRQGSSSHQNDECQSLLERQHIRGRAAGPARRSHPEVGGHVALHITKSFLMVIGIGLGMRSDTCFSTPVLTMRGDNLGEHRHEFTYLV